MTRTVGSGGTGSVASNTLVSIDSSGYVETCSASPCDGVALSAASNPASVQVALSGTVQVSGTGSPTPTQGHIATFYPGSAGLVQDSGQTDPGGASSPTSSLPGLAGATLVGKILGYNSGSGLFMLQLYGPGLYASRIASGTLANEPTTCAAMGLLYVATDQPIGAQIYTSTGTPPTCSWTAIGTVAATPSELAVRDTGGGLTSTSFATTGTTSTAFVLNQ